VSSVLVDTEVFARLVGRYPDEGLLLFKVTQEAIEADGLEWSPPVQFRFKRQKGAFVELEFRVLEDQELSDLTFGPKEPA
jgi:hypothetical protein